MMIITGQGGDTNPNFAAGATYQGERVTMIDVKIVKAHLLTSVPSLFVTLKEVIERDISYARTIHIL